MSTEHAPYLDHHGDPSAGLVHIVVTLSVKNRCHVHQRNRWLKLVGVTSCCWVYRRMKAIELWEEFLMKSWCFLVFHKTNHRPSKHVFLKRLCFPFELTSSQLPSMNEFESYINNKLVLVVFGPKLRPRFPAGACHRSVSIQPGRSGISRGSTKFMFWGMINKSIHFRIVFTATTCLCLNPCENKKNRIMINNHILHVVFMRYQHSASFRRGLIGLRLLDRDTA